MSFLAVSEICVHLEILVNEGRAELADPGPPAVYRALEYQYVYSATFC